ncbi:hypothetical protein Plhal304r1_c015g0055991 [Plasmopara halstedii]
MNFVQMFRYDVKQNFVVSYILLDTNEGLLLKSRNAKLYHC